MVTEEATGPAESQIPRSCSGMQIQFTRPKAVSVTTKQQVCTMCSALEKWGFPHRFKRILKSMLLNNSKLSYKKNGNCWKLYGVTVHTGEDST